jgi:site-specific DNA-cytosine methylase
MKILVACEFSGRVREAFAAAGHDAWSCDILPTEVAGNHIQGDVFEVINQGWDMMIAHPPCTYLSSVGNRHLKQPGRIEKRQEAYEFVMRLWAAPIERVAIENPVGYLNTAWRKPDQIIEPYYFGDPVKKAPCLWLRGLPRLRWDKLTAAYPEPVFYSTGEKTKGKAIHWCEAVKSKDPSERARTFPGIAEAMAKQWGGEMLPVQQPLFQVTA